MVRACNREYGEDVSKLANIIKPVIEFSEKFYNLIEKIGTVELWISDPGHTSTTTLPWVEVLEAQLKKELDCLESFENQRCGGQNRKKATDCLQQLDKDKVIDQPTLPPIPW